MTDINNENTDDLSAFEAELFGSAKPKEPEATEVKAEVKEEVVEPQETGEVEPAAEETPIEEEEIEVPEEDDKTKLRLKKKQTFQERINELTAKAREAERHAENLQARLAQLEAAKVEVKEAPAPEYSGPTPDDKTEDGLAKYELGEFDPKYIRDLTRYTFEQEKEAFRAQEEERRALEAIQAERTAIHQSWETKLQEAEKEIPDLREKGMRLETAFAGMDEGYAAYLTNTVMTLDHGPEVLYYLSENLDEAQKIITGGPVKATVALGRIDAMFSKPKTQTKKVSEAPEPPVSRARGAGGRFETPDDTDDLDAFAKKLFG